MIGYLPYLSVPGITNTFCDWVPFAYKLDVCHVPSPEEIIKNVEYGGAMTAENRAIVEQQSRETLQAYLRMHPEIEL